MILPIRHRAGLLLTGLVIAAPLLASGAAVAGSTTITFSGQPPLGVSTLACPSTPSQTALTVAVNTTVDFVNRTGRTATLWAGNSQKDLPDKSLVPVTFTQGPATVVVQMLPKCSLDLGKHISMTVTVVAAGAPTPTTGAPTGGAGSGSSTGSSGSGTPRSGPTSGGTHSAPATTPSPNTSPAGSHGGSGSGSPKSNAGIGDNNPFQAAPAGAAKGTVIGSAQGPRPPRSASGLLTLIATVGVVGVAAAAIRAILAQRANRTLIA